MRVRITSARTAGRPRLAVLSCATLMVLVGIALSACTGAPSSSVPAIFSPSGSASGGSTADGSASHSGTETATASASTKTATATTTPTPTATTVSPSPVPSTSYYYPTGAPETGGGGTAGLQDGAVFVLGGAAIAAGLGSLAYRRRVTRRR